MISSLFLKNKNKKLLHIVFSFLFAATLFINTQPCFSQSYTADEQVNINVYDSVNPSIVAIDVDIPDGTSSGTGIIINNKGVILTSSHILEESGTIVVTLASGKKFPGRIIAITKENSDLALIKINPTTNLPTARLGDSTKIKVGQKVLAIGNPFGFTKTLTTGIISRIDYEKNKIQTDAAINPGCSGGPILNSTGEVIGISQSIYNPDNNRSNIGIGFAVPVNAAKRFINSSQNEIKASLIQK